MTRCDLLNISKVKQIVPRVQIWFYGSSVLQLVQSSYPRHKARHKGTHVARIGAFIWEPIVHGISSGFLLKLLVSKAGSMSLGINR